MENSDGGVKVGATEHALQSFWLIAWQKNLRQLQHIVFVSVVYSGISLFLGFGST